MLRKTLYALALLALLILLLLLLPEGTAGAADQVGDESQAEPVRVVNLPRVQEVSGRVEVEGPVTVSGPVRHARAAVLEEVPVTPTGGRQPVQLIEAGTLTTDGFGFVTLSLLGEVRGRGSHGRIGALLVPDVAEAEAAFRDGHALASLEVEGVVEAASPWVGTTSPRLAVAFPRYRVYLFNTSERTVAARVYAYLSS